MPEAWRIHPPAVWRTVRVFMSFAFRYRRTGHDQRALTLFPARVVNLRRPRTDPRSDDTESALVDSTTLAGRLLAGEWRT